MDKKHRYYLFTEKSFRDEHFISDEEAINSIKASPDVIRLVRAQDGKELLVKPFEKVFLKA